MFYVVMRTKLLSPALGAVAFLFVAPLSAQISESDSSLNLLAMQCSMSSGFSSADFDDYSRRLAKTLALLSPAQQTRVFGYLPQPNGNVKGDGDSLPTSPGQQMADGKTTNDPSTSDAPVDVAEPAAGALDGLVAMIGDFNDSISGNKTPAAPPIYAGVDLSVAADVPGVGKQIAAAASAGVTLNTPAGDGGLDVAASASVSAPGAVVKEPAASTAPKPNSWDALLSWFKAAEDAYNAGTLKEFLQTQP